MTQRVVNYTYGTGNSVLPDGSIDVRDGIDNLQSMDVFMNAPEDTYNQRDGDVVRTVAGMNNEFDAHILNMGFTRIGTFAAGATLTNPRQTLLWDVADGGDGQEYGWSGAFPPLGKVVSPGSTPLTTGGIAVGAWMSRFDPALRVQTREALRRSYAEVGRNLVDGSFEAGGTLVNANDVLLQERTGKAFSGPAGTVAAGTDPTSGEFVDRSGVLAKINHTSVAEMVANHSLVVGNKVETAKYNASGVMNWEVVNTSSNDSHYVSLSNGLFAKLIIGAEIDPICFGAFNTIDELTGAAEGFCDTAFAEAQTVGNLIKKPIKHSPGIYRLVGNYVLKGKTTGVDKESCVIIFNEGFGFRTYDTPSVRYFIPEISGLSLHSDKSSHWNTLGAGDSYVPDISKFMTRLKYGQRVAKGNKITTPNNILALDSQQQQDGTGFWNKDYSQWTQSANVEVNISDVPLSVTSDSCIIYSEDRRKVIRDCNFFGFKHGLVLAGTTQIGLSDLLFASCRVGVFAAEGNYVGGSFAAKTTTLDMQRCLFEDVDIGVYGASLLQSKIRDTNVFQPCRVGVYVGDGGAAGTRISGNYFEVGHTFFYHKPNLPMRGAVADNFTNTSYARYLAWCNSGQELRFSEPQGLQTIRMAAGVQLSDVDSRFLLEVDPNFFVTNRNVIDGAKPKQFIIRTLGVGGTSVTITKLWSSVNTKAGSILAPAVTGSQAGLAITQTTTSRVLAVEMMDENAVFSYFDADGESPQNKAVYYFSKINDTAIDLREAGIVHTIKITWMEK